MDRLGARHLKQYSCRKLPFTANLHIYFMASSEWYPYYEVAVKQDKGDCLIS
jgi:hypothetical protein